MNETQHRVVIVGCAITAQRAAAITAGAAAAHARGGPSHLRRHDQVVTRCGHGRRMRSTELGHATE